MQQIIKLTSGDTIIANIVSSDKNLKVSNPMLIKHGIDDENRLVVTLIKWMETEVDAITIFSDHVVSLAPPSSFLAHYYDQTVQDDDEDFDFEEEAPVFSSFDKPILH